MALPFTVVPTYLLITSSSAVLLKTASPASNAVMATQWQSDDYLIHNPFTSEKYATLGRVLEFRQVCGMPISACTRA